MKRIIKSTDLFTLILFVIVLFFTLYLTTKDVDAQDATPEAQPEVTAEPAPDVVVNVEQPETTNAQSIFNIVVLIVGAILGGGTVWVISPRIRTNIENDPAAMDSIERKYFTGNAATREFINKAAAEARGWLDFQQKISDGVLSDGTRLE